MTDLPAYTGPGGDCPKCGAGGVLTEWHYTGKVTFPGDKPYPCGSRSDLNGGRGQSQHLCRICANCGFGWVEACIGNGNAARLRLVPGGEGADQCPI